MQMSITIKDSIVGWPGRVVFICPPLLDALPVPTQSSLHISEGLNTRTMPLDPQTVIIYSRYQQLTSHAP